MLPKLIRLELNLKILCNLVKSIFYKSFDKYIRFQVQPCMNGGKCVDGINAYECHCQDTGFEGQICEINIDECASNPCVHNSTCTDLINDYNCNCFEGYDGKNCQDDINECSQIPCKNDGACFERSNQTLYLPSSLSNLPVNISTDFDQPFSYANAAGYVCSCIPGFTGDNCEININECEGDPCLHGKCLDLVNEYQCECDPGYEGENCEIEINECERYQPCQHGSCIDMKNDYLCQCEDLWGGKNCSVALIGCLEFPCLNNGTCTPWLIGETDHRANCTCAEGFAGKQCEFRTTFSISENSYIKVPYWKPDGYELYLHFRTTLTDGLVAHAFGSEYHLTLSMQNTKIVLQSNLINRIEGISIGEALNDKEFKKVYVAANTTHLTLGVEDRLQATHPISTTDPNDTVFPNTYIGGTIGTILINHKNPVSLISCVRDVTVNGLRITEENLKPDAKEKNVLPLDSVNVDIGCNRQEQCGAKTCKNSGNCIDLWESYSCICNRPFLGQSCEFNYTGGTFGYEETQNSIAVVDIENPKPYQSMVDISMFIRTRKEDGFIFYFGSDPAPAQGKQTSYITGELVTGNLVVHVYFDGNPKPDRFQVYTVNLSDGYRHFIKVFRENNAMRVMVNESVSINHEIPSPTAFVAQKLYLGNYPNEEVLSTTTTTTTTLRTTTTAEISTQRFTPAPASPPVVAPVKSSSISPRQLSVESTTTSAENAILEPEEEDNTLLENFSSSGIVKRSRRAVDENSRTGINSPLGIEVTHSHFKGIIQDVQIAANNNTWIVELFQDTFAESVEMPKSIGEIRLINVEKGVVSDETCISNPCMNGGTCEVTWNDYQCSCTEGYRGRNCADKEYCFWYTCPEGSVCQSLVDGHECISNATFNGVNSTLTVRPNLSRNVENSTSIEVEFRSQVGGTMLQIYQSAERFIQLSLEESNLIIEVPELNQVMHRSILEINNEEGEWQKVRVEFTETLVTAKVGNSTQVHITLDPDVLNLADFVTESQQIIVGASLAFNAPANAYNLGNPEDTTLEPVVSVNVQSNDLSDYENHFRGCLRNIRIADVLIPFFLAPELVNNTATDRFDVLTRDDVLPSSCILCYEHECQNGGKCADPQERFECQCPDGFEDALCSTNIDECVINQCQHESSCVDRIANYTCDCLPGWTGWLCDEDLDECLSQPCLNDGLCTQTVEPGGYTCQCTDEYEGPACMEVKNKTCADIPCQNDALCIQEYSKSPYFLLFVSLEF